MKDAPTHRRLMRSLCLLAVSIAAAAAFSTSSPRVARSSRTRPVRMEETAPPAAAPRLFELKIAMPSKKGTAALRFKARLPASEALVVRYAIPFGLDVAPKDGLAIVTKDGAGGEKVRAKLGPLEDVRVVQPLITVVHPLLTVVHPLPTGRRRAAVLHRVEPRGRGHRQPGDAASLASPPSATRREPARQCMQLSRHRDLD